MKASEEDHGHQMTQVKCEAKAREVVWGVKISGFESWSPELVASAQSLLAKYHDMSSHWSLVNIWLVPHSTEHVIKVTDDTPFKEWFRQIPLPLIEEVHKHLPEMLDSGTICPSHSMWCNAVALVQKKDEGLCSCIDFWHVSMPIQKRTHIPYLGSNKPWKVW